MKESFTSVPEELERGLAAAFRRREAPADGASVLDRLRERTEVPLDVHLPEPASEGSGPVVRVESREEGSEAPRAGRYQVQGEIARGGVGVVFRGRDQDLGRDVALKVLNERHVEDPEMLARFVEEAQIGGQLQHPGIVPVYELGLQHDQQPFFAMKLVKGETLSSLLKKRDTPADERRRFLGIFEQVCQTAAYAHARQVVHRDLKPSNVMVGAFGEVQVVDWGLAKILKRGAGERNTKSSESEGGVSVISSTRSRGGSESLTGSVMGTPAYMPPEQARGEVESMDARSDVFSLGAILCEILTGAPPYSGSRDDCLRQATLCATQTALEDLRERDLDTGLVALVEDCLRAELDDRPHDAEAVAGRIGAYLAGVEERARAAELRSVRAQVRTRWVGGLAAAIVVLTLGGTWGYVERARRLDARSRDAASQARAALDEAHSLSGSARALLEVDGASDVGLARLSEARAAADKARALARDADASTRAKVDAYRAELASQHEDAAARADALERDRSLVEALLAARVSTEQRFGVHLGYWQEVGRLDREYGRIFREHGVDLDVTSAEEAAERLRGSASSQVAGALEEWAYCRRFLEASWEAIARGEADSAVGFPLGREPVEHLRDGNIPEPYGPFYLPLDVADQLLERDDWYLRLHEQIALGPPDLDVLRELRDELRRDGGPPRSWLILASLFSWASADDEHMELLELGQVRYPGEFLLTVELATASWQKRDYERAARNYAAAAALRPDLVKIQRFLGDALQEIDPAAALPIFERLKRLEPGNAEWESELATTLWMLWRVDEAGEACRRALSLRPDDFGAQWNLGLVLKERGELDEAVGLLGSALKNGSNMASSDAHAYLVYARALLSSGRYAEAAAAYRQSLENWAHFARLHGAEASLAVAEDLAESSDSYKALVQGRRTSNRGEDWIRAAVLLTRLGRHLQAKEAYEKAFTLSPELAGDHCFTAACSAVLAATEGDAPATELRHTALQWLRSDLDHWLGIDETIHARIELLDWMVEGDLSSVRDASGLASLPQRERQDWQGLWGEVRTFLEVSLRTWAVEVK